MRRNIKRVAGAALAGLIATSAAVASTAVAGQPEESADLVSVKQAGFRVLYLWPEFLADQLGYFADAGIDYEYIEVESGALGVASLVSGEVQVTDMGINDAANLHAQGTELLLVYQMLSRLTMDLIVRTEVVDELGLTPDMPLEERFAALEGLNIGITAPGAVTDTFSRYYLTQAGLDPDRDANIVPVGGAAALAAALTNGQIDAYMLSPPGPYALAEEGIGSIIIRPSAGDVPALANVPFASITVTREFAEENPEVVDAYLGALRESIAWATDHRDEALEMVGEEFPEVDPGVLAAGWDALLPAISPTGEFSEAGVEAYLQIMVDAGQFDELPPTEEGVLWTNDFVPE